MFDQILKNKYNKYKEKKQKNKYKEAYLLRVTQLNKF